jgi:hypothetical protein
MRIRAIREQTVPISSTATEPISIPSSPLVGSRTAQLLALIWKSLLD